MSFLLRVEGVNHANFIEDSQDLSTIRGGGLLLLDAAEKVEEALATLGCSSKPIVQGASIGLFRVHSAPHSAEDVRRAVEAELCAWLPHATFVVDVNDSDEDSASARAAVWARNRWRQMQAPTVVYPSLHGTMAEPAVCEIDKVRPAAHPGSLGPRGKQVQSAATHVRRAYGRAEKQSFYRREMARTGPPDPPDLAYTEDFEDLCGSSAHWGNLADKMAVLHLDGNKFTDLAIACRKEEQLAAFSRGLRNEQARILRTLVEEEIKGDPAWRNGSDLRLETLLWGGDEITWVVPAWKGWRTLQFFFAEWPVNPASGWSPDATPLTYSAALVFCHRKAPIHTITRLARELVGQVKRSYGADKPRDNRFLYQVLESFDHISAVDESYLPLVLPARAMDLIAGAMPFWRTAISRKKLHQLLQNPATAQAIAGEIKAELARAGAAEAEKSLGDLEQLAGEAAWRHIAELWDYAAPEKDEIAV